MTVQIDSILERIDRVVIDEHGEAKSAMRAQEEHSISPDIAFIRNDGWTLGAPKSFNDVAFKMWSGEWMFYAEAPNWNLKPISEYKA
jgi:hypothetical protein